MNRKPLYPLANLWNHSLNDDSIRKEFSFGKNDPLATADSAKAQQLNKSITKSSRTVLKAYPYDKTVIDGFVVLDGTGVVSGIGVAGVQRGGYTVNKLVVFVIQLTFTAHFALSPPQNTPAQSPFGE